MMLPEILVLEEQKGHKVYPGNKSQDLLLPRPQRAPELDLMILVVSPISRILWNRASSPLGRAALGSSCSPQRGWGYSRCLVTHQNGLQRLHLRDEISGFQDALWSIPGGKNGSFLTLSAFVEFCIKTKNKFCAYLFNTGLGCFCPSQAIPNPILSQEEAVRIGKPGPCWREELRLLKNPNCPSEVTQPGRN